ncbi:MAG: metallophosphoesterase, partial [Clostridia bacterium]|nr:metallophosphoesterase [Clostridia bacterium]
MNLKRISLIALALVMVFTTCIGAIASIDFTIGGSKEAQYAILGEQAGLCMTVGSDETERNFAWYSTHTTGSIEYALRDGDTFPATYTTVNTIASPAANSYVHRATIYDLKPDSEYVYRIKNSGKVSQNYYFTTDSVVNFDFVFAGDPQIGASYNNTRDGQNWGKTVDFVRNNFPEISLFVTAGDQVNNGNDEGEYEAFLSPTNLPTFALAPAVGNHEDAYATDEYPDLTYAIFTEHYNLPNRYIDGKLYGKTTAGSDYWYTYNNVLFIHINTNNHSPAEHEAFIKNAVESNPNVTWRFIVQHFAFFGSHYFVGDAINERRNTYGPMYQKYGIDMVLNGHEHDLVRSHMINYTDTGYTYTDVGNSVTDPSGIFYLTACSSSSSKFYDLIDASLTPHIAYKDNNKQTVTYCQVTANTFKFTTYDVLNNVVLDTFQITKTKNISNAYDTNVALGKTYTNDPLYIKSGDTTPRYPDEGGTMTDGKYAPVDAIYKDEAFMAFYKPDSFYQTQGYAAITVDLGQKYDLQRFVAQVGTTCATSGIVAPKSMSVYVSDDKSTWTKAGECTVTDSTTDSCIPMSVNLDKSVNG